MTTTAQRPATPVIQRNRREIAGWIFMRVSGLALLFLALGHFAIQHIINDVHNLSLDFVAMRWALTGWRIYDALLLALALVHGLNGLRTVADDYVHNERLKRVFRWGIIVVGGLLMIIGMVALVGGVRAQPS